MGLDQYASVVVTDEDGKNKKVEDIAQWRKHPNLQGWMENLWREKGLSETGEWNEFSCVDLELTLEDINRLEWDVREGDLPETEGFFFGSNSDSEYKKEDLEFCEKARILLKEGKKVIYRSWW